MQPRSRTIAGGPGQAGWSTALLNPVSQTLFGLLSVFLLGLTIWSGLKGTEAPDRNFSVTFAYVTVYLGFVLLERRFR